VAAVSEVLKSTFDSARTRLAGLEKSVHKLEKKAQSSIDGIQARFDGAPKRIEGAWTSLTARLKTVPVFATRAEVRELADKLDELAAKVEKLSQGKGRGRSVS